MAMTKKEREKFDAAMHKLRVVGALRWTTPIPPDLAPPIYGGDLVKGWLYNSYNGTASKACTSSVSHGLGSDDRTTSQGCRRLYSTELLALKAARSEMEFEFAAKLARVDERIERLQSEV